jgi:hypothetical protein
MRRKLLLWALLVGALVLAALYLTCGRGWGLGGKGKGSGSGPGPGPVQTLIAPSDGPRECQIRVAAGGITVGGKQATALEAVASCKDAAVAEVFLTGGAREGDWEDLKAALDRAGVQIRRIEPEGGSGSRGP